MINFYNALHTSIDMGGYELTEMEERIDRIWVEGKITTEQRDELRVLAAENAKDSDQIDIIKAIADLQARVYELEHPTDIYPIWAPGYITKQHEIVRFDVTGDGELDLCRYDGGRSETSLSIGKIEGWHLLDRELNETHIISKDSDGNFVLTPIVIDSEPDDIDENYVDPEADDIDENYVDPV